MAAAHTPPLPAVAQLCTCSKMHECFALTRALVVAALRMAFLCAARAQIRREKDERLSTQ